MEILKRGVIYFLGLSTLFSCSNSVFQKDSKDSPTNSQSIDKPYIVSEIGDTIPTGVPIHIQGRKIQLNNANVINVNLKKEPKIVNSDRKIEVGEEPKKIKIKDHKSYIIPGKNGVPLPKDTMLVGRKVEATYPKPSKFGTPQYRDNAIVDVQWFDVDQGLNSSYVICSFEDSRNNVWIGYYGGGLSKFDGTEFLHFTENEGLLNNYVWTIFEDSKGNLWFGHYYGGLTQYDGKTFTHYSKENGLPDKTIWSIIEDSQGELWFGTMNGVLNYNGISFKHYTTENGLVGNNVVSIIEDSQDNIWFGTKSSGVTVYNGESFTSYTEHDGLPDNKILSMFEDSDHNVWLGTQSGGVCKYDGSSFQTFTKNEGLSHNKVISIVEDENENVWFATHGGGLSRYDGKTFYNITTKEGLPHDQLRHLRIDNDNILWAGMEGAGLLKFNVNSFKHYTVEEGLPHEQVFSIYEDTNGLLWFGTFGGGLSSYDGINFMHYGEDQGLIAKNIISITEDKNGNIWFGTFDNGLFMFDFKSFTQYTTSAGLTQNMVWNVLADNNDNIWFGTELGGISKFDGAEFINYNLEEGFSSNTVWDIIEDSNSNIWMGTNQGGLCKYADDKFTFYGKNEGVSHNIVWSLLEDKNNDIWFGTHKGLCRYNGEIIECLDMEDGLTNDVVWSVLEDHDGNIWAATNKGLNCVVTQDNTRFDLDSTYISNYLKNDGLKSVIFYANSSVLDKNNTAWFGTISSLINLDLDQFGVARSSPNVELKGITINERDIQYNLLSDSIYGNSSDFLNRMSGYASEVESFNNYPQSLELPFDFNHLTFSFVGIDWRAPQDIIYSYQMSGLDNHWSVPTEENKADYRNIPPGDYTFMVKAKGKSQEWSEPSIYSFSISPPWWLTIWAILLYVLLGLLIVGLSFYWYSSRMLRRQMELENIVTERTQTIREQKIEVEGQKEELIKAYAELEKERNKMELKALLNQINPHFIFNALNSIQQFILKNKTKSSLDYFNKFGKLMRSSLEHSELKFVSLDDEMGVIRNYVDLENLRFETPMILTFNTNGIDIYNVKIPPMFIQPFVENAIIHGLSKKEGKKTIDVDFEDMGSYVICSVTDNGVGRKSSLESKKGDRNSGLKITQKRLNSIWTMDMNDLSIKFIDLKNSEMNPIGTTAKVKLPKEF